LLRVKHILNVLKIYICRQYLAITFRCNGFVNLGTAYITLRYSMSIIVNYEIYQYKSTFTKNIDLIDTKRCINENYP